MPVLLELADQGVYYRVTRAGKAVRLYRNNVLHSQWNPAKPLAGKLWDLFLLTAMATEKQLQKVLVLGAGGGSVINLIHHFYPHAEVDAIDLDKNHLDIATKYFKVNTSQCQLIHADAIHWVKQYRGSQYDMIIDDVFSESDCIPYRCIQSRKDWAEELVKHLKKDGILVFNFADQKEWHKDLQRWRATLGKFNTGIARHDQCDNKIVHCSINNISRQTILRGVRQIQTKHYHTQITRGTFDYYARKARA